MPARSYRMIYQVLNRKAIYQNAGAEGNGQMLVGRQNARGWCRERVQVRAGETGIAREPAARELRSK